MNLFKKPEDGWNDKSLPDDLGFYWAKFIWGDVEPIKITYIEDPNSNKKIVEFEALGFEYFLNYEEVECFYGPIEPPNIKDIVPNLFKETKLYNCNLDILRKINDKN